MNNRTNGWTAGVLAVALCALVLVFATPRATAQQGGRGNSLVARIAALEATVGAQQGQIASLTSRVAVLEEKTQFMSVLGDTTLFSGTNVQVVNGMGGTQTINGLGNLIVGYNNAAGMFGDERSGSHNLVVGDLHDYLGVGGFVAGFANRIAGPASSVSGGSNNKASAYASSVTGGLGNTASTFHSAVSGGQYNTASGSVSSISGGYDNTASGNFSSVSGGRENTSSGYWSSVSGGFKKSATVIFQWVGGAYHTP